ncbi:uncharacterized protein C8A04DRAFT_40669 [Dichotomopilus funicola]|uniref:Methyltransferase type 12 domain-containing protein n=1 Tax=Dichotomopilus funicola TaxID=1934379 RepID=A0AAN6UVC0_9PEZI|nr:hypothetical protein C8A04DRAFT_40669 [Dichotomopilus funicola]
MTASNADDKGYLVIEEIPERLDEQHTITTQTLGFLVHPLIPILLSPNDNPPSSSTLTFTPSTPLKIADIGTGTGAWLLDIAAHLPPSLPALLTGYDLVPPSTTTGHTAAALTALHKSHPNLTIQFLPHDMHHPFPTPELATYDLVAARFVSSAMTRGQWKDVLGNVKQLVKPATGWVQWIESCNFRVYDSVPSVAGTAKVGKGVFREVWEGLEPFRELVIGLMVREARDVKREELWRSAGLVDVHEEVFSTDRIQDPTLQIREKGTRNVMECYLGCLETLVGAEGSGWTKERLERVRGEVDAAIDKGVYHALDQVCMIGRRPEEE